MILLIDNYDSFVFNLERYFQRLGQETVVVRNDAIKPEEVADYQSTAIVFSPGPRGPRQAGVAIEIVKRYADSIPMLGVCLGHQILAEAFGGEVIRAKQPMHGRTSQIQHDGRGVFHGLPSPLEVCRYHSLIVRTDRLPSCLEMSAHTHDGVIMALRHRSRPIVGLQFHPEAILTQSGFEMLRRFLIDIGQPTPPKIADEWRWPAKPDFVAPSPNRPITF